VWGVVDGLRPSTTPHTPFFLRRYLLYSLLKLLVE